MLCKTLPSGFLEAIRKRNMWNASQEEIDGLMAIYLTTEGDIEGMHE